MENVVKSYLSIPEVGTDIITLLAKLECHNLVHTVNCVVLVWRWVLEGSAVGSLYQLLAQIVER